MIMLQSNYHLVLNKIVRLITPVMLGLNLYHSVFKLLVKCCMSAESNGPLIVNRLKFRLSNDILE